MANNYLHNFKTGENDYRDLSEIPTDELKNYMVQWPELHTMFDIYIEMGETPLEAYRKCLETSMR